MTIPLRCLLLPLLVSLSFLHLACGSGDSGKKKQERDGVTETGVPVLRAEVDSQSGLSGSALIACLESEPKQRTVTVTNTGDAAATLRFHFDGPGAQSFTVSPINGTTELAPGAALELRIEFVPDRPGESWATLVIDDGVESTRPLEVPFTVLVQDLPPKPTLDVHVARPELSIWEPCDVFGICRLDYAPTYFGQSRSLPVRVQNSGCEPLRVTRLELSKGPAGGENLAFFVEAPALLPSEATPWVIEAGADAKTDIKVRFQPERDNSSSSLREGILRVWTNDPATPEFAISLMGEATAPNTYAEPERCNFTDATDLCGLPTKDENLARFRIFNAGELDAQVTAEFLDRAQERFALVTSLDNAPLAANGFVDIEVRHTGAPGSTFVAERLVIRATVDGAPAGETFIDLGGGAAPRLSTEPSTQLAFSKAAQGELEKTVTLSNAEGAGTLVIDRVSIDDGRYFELVDAPAPGTTVAPGATLTFKVRHIKPPSGGLQATVLRIETNDPAFAAPAYKVLTLYSETPLDQIPLAAIQVRPQGTPTWHDGPYTQSLAAIEGPDKRLELTCDPSRDPNPQGAAKRVQRCEFRLVKKPRLATQTSLDFDGERIEAYKDGEPVLVNLRLTPNVVGQYQVDVYAYDEAGQRSSQPARLLIHAVQ